MRNPIQNIYIKKVEKKKMFGYDKDELWNTVIKTYPNVSQFWTYGKDKFLAQPVYEQETSRPASSANNCDNAGARSGPGALLSHQSPRVTDSKTNAPVLELRNLSKNFGGLKATRDVSFRVMAGDRKAIIGPNGAGKTTLFNLITGIYPVSSGRCCCSARTLPDGRATTARPRAWRAPSRSPACFRNSP